MLSYILQLKVLIILLFASVVASAKTAISVTNETKIDRLMRPYSGDKKPGAAVAVFKNNQAVFMKGYGSRDLKNNTAGYSPVTITSNFRLASVSKQFTAMAVLQLIESGQIDFETKLTDIFSDFPRYGRKISVYHLLTHTSGLKKYERNLPPNQSEQVSDRDVLKIMKRMNGTVFTPGSRYQYSNSGYALLAMIVEKISGLRFSEYVAAGIFNRIGMNRSLAFEKERHRIDERVYGHLRRGDRFVRGDQNIFSAVLGDGGIYSSISDLFKWNNALDGNELVSRQLMEKAFSRARLSNGKAINYGFGWRIGWHRGEKVVYHTGSSIGFKNILLKIPGRSMAVIVLTNRHSPSPANLAFKIADLYWSVR